VSTRSVRSALLAVIAVLAGRAGNWTVAVKGAEGLVPRSDVKAYFGELAAAAEAFGAR
jgi:hypothetical protein